MNTTEKLFHWMGVALLTTAILLSLFEQLPPASVVRMLVAGSTLYGVGVSRYMRRLEQENHALRQPAAEGTSWV
ncbi:hypothetical protein [Hymenobacter sp. DG01]|uniref:hypothetical protein n=1 Tax=Hymenobacter sp. DG01 TaxID=2584940 RepID=UPI00112336AE|nr:hypothetical protein [Hymenobacter sp. DG01]